MTKFLQKNEIPGLSLSISYKKEIIFSKGFGFSDLKLRKEVNPSKTKFRIALQEKIANEEVLVDRTEQQKIISEKKAIVAQYDAELNTLLAQKETLGKDSE